jgi:hypothetical protein
VDGVHFTIRLEEERLCALVVIGVRPDGTKEVVALEDGYRESAESWRTLLRDLKRRAARPGARGRRWGAGLLGRRARRVARDRGAALLGASDRQRVGQAPQESPATGEAGAARDHVRRDPRGRSDPRFTAAYQAKYPKAVASLTVDQDRLLAYFDYPAEHWKHLRTTNPIESTFATVRLREGVTKGAGSRTAGLVMAFKLLQVAEGHWRCLAAAALIPLVRAGVCFEDGVQIEPQKKRKKVAA